MSTSYYLKDEMGVELTNPVSVARLMPWNSPDDFPILEKEFEKQPLVLVNSTGDLIDGSGFSDSEEDTGEAVDKTWEDENYEHAVMGSLEGSNPVKKSNKERPKEDPKKVKAGVLSTLELPDTSANRLLLGHGVKRNAQGKLVFEQRLVPQTEKRRVNKPKKLNL
jgi:hypothetical protein